MAVQQQLGDYNHHKMSTSSSEKNPEPAKPHTQGAFQKSASWTIAGLVILTMKKAFTKKKNLLCIPVTIIGSDEVVLIKSEIIIGTGTVWPVGSDKWKANSVISQAGHRQNCKTKSL